MGKIGELAEAGRSSPWNWDGGLLGRGRASVSGLFCTSQAKQLAQKCNTSRKLRVEGGSEAIDKLELGRKLHGTQMPASHTRWVLRPGRESGESPAVREVAV